MDPGVDPWTDLNDCVLVLVVNGMLRCSLESREVSVWPSRPAVVRDEEDE
jgi:hypothetical protein